MEFHAHAAHEAKAALQPFNYTPADPGPDDVDVRISHCGICHSDVHVVDNDWGISKYPVVPGHEIIGEVEAVGAGVTHLKPGDRVGVGWQRGSCMTCEWCTSGQENLCARMQATILGGNYGGFADRIRLDGKFAFKVPGDLESENAAPLLCAGITVYSPLLNFGIKPAMRVGVIGIGGLGHLALQFARAWGCRVTAFSGNPDKEQEAHSFGAHQFVQHGSSSAMRRVMGSQDLIINTAFGDMDWGLWVNVLRPNGRLVFAGAPAGPLNFPPALLLGGRKSVSGSPIGSRFEIEEMLGFAARHGIKAQTEARPMAEANAALEHVRQGKARYRMVLTN